MAQDGSVLELLGDRTIKRELPVPIVTTRLELRPFRESDIGRMAQLLSDPEVTRFIGDVKSSDAAAESVRLMADAFADRGWGTLAVVPRGQIDCVGYCGVRPLAHTPEVEIAFALRQSCWNLGFATEAAAASIDAAFKTLGIQSIVATVYPENTRSLRVLAKLGLKHESRVFGHWPMRIALLFRIKRTEWRGAATAASMLPL